LRTMCNSSLGVRNVFLFSFCFYALFLKKNKN
jgi:hypothetical protein